MVSETILFTFLAISVLFFMLLKECFFKLSIHHLVIHIITHFDIMNFIITLFYSIYKGERFFYHKFLPLRKI